MVTYKVLLGLFMALLMTPAVMAVTDIANCANLDIDGMEYRLTANVSVTTRITCFNITANNVTLNGGGNFVDWRHADAPLYGVINISNLTNVTIKNIFLNESSASNIHLIRIKNSNSTKIINVNFSTEYVALNFDLDIRNSTFTNNNFSGAYPVFFAGTTGNFTDNWFEGNTFTKCSSGCFYCNSGVANSWCTNNTFTMNTFNKSAGATYYFAGYPDADPTLVNRMINNTMNWSFPGMFGLNVGNFYDNATGANGFSDICTDADDDGICDSSFGLTNNERDYRPRSNRTLSYFAGLSFSWPEKTVETRMERYNASYISSSCSNMSFTVFRNGTYIGAMDSSLSLTALTSNLEGETNQTNITFVFATSCGSAQANYTGSHFTERLRLLQCALPMGNITASFNIYDEDNNAVRPISNFDMAASIYIDGGYRNYSFGLVKNHTYEFCIFPGWASYNLNTTVKYSNSSYDERWYYTEGAAMDNTTENITLYLLNSSSSISPTFTILNIYQAKQLGVILKAQRWFVALNQYKEVATGMSGSVGEVQIPLKPNEQYRFILERGGDILNSIGPELLYTTTTGLDLYTSSGAFSDLWDYYGKIAATCSNVSSVLTCQFIDTSGLSQTTSLKVESLNFINKSTVVCSSSTTASSGTLFCDFGYYTNTTIRYTFVSDLSNGLQITLFSGIITGSAPVLDLGSYGLFAAFFLILTLTLIGLSRPELGVAGPVVFGYIGVVVSWWFGLIQVEWMMITGLGAGAAVMAYALTRSRV